MLLVAQVADVKLNFGVEVLCMQHEYSLAVLAGLKPVRVVVLDPFARHGSHLLHAHAMALSHTSCPGHCACAAELDTSFLMLMLVSPFHSSPLICNRLACIMETTTAHNDSDRLGGTHDMHDKLHGAAHDRPDSSRDITHSYPHDVTTAKPRDDADGDADEIPRGEVAQDNHLEPHGDKDESNHGLMDSNALYDDHEQPSENNASGYVEPSDNENESIHGAADGGVLDEQPSADNAGNQMESQDDENSITHCSAAEGVLDSGREQTGEKNAGNHISWWMEGAREAQERYVRGLSPRTKARLQVRTGPLIVHARAKY
jgi:hypothetical protein